MKRFNGAVVVLLGLPLALCGCAGVADQLDASPPPLKASVEGVLSVGMTVRDMDRATDFYSKVLSFEKVSDIEVTGTEYERLTGVFGQRMRIVRMKLGDESLELTEYL